MSEDKENQDKARILAERIEWVGRRHRDWSDEELDSFGQMREEYWRLTKNVKEKK